MKLSLPAIICSLLLPTLAQADTTYYSYNDGSGTHYYSYLAGSNSWDAAQASALALTYEVEGVTYYGSLVSINSIGELSTVRTIIDTEDSTWAIAWLGGHYSDALSKYIWTDGTELDLDNNSYNWTTSTFETAGYYGTTINGGGYGYDIKAQPSAQTYSGMVIEYTPVPEPATYAMLGGIAALGLAALRKKRLTK